jgi:NADH-quinone oxidoreductase subunit J
VVTVFAVLAAGILVSGIGVVAFRRPIYNALSLVINMLGLAGLFLLLNAQFLFAAQIIVYAGAVMVLFVFIIALLNPQADIQLTRPAGRWQLMFALVFGVIFAGMLVALFSHSAVTGRPGQLTPAVIDRAGNVQSTGAALYTDFLLPVEVTSVLLLVAAVGAVYLALRRVK